MCHRTARWTRPAPALIACALAAALGAAAAPAEARTLTRFYMRARPFYAPRDVTADNPSPHFGGVLADVGVEATTGFGLRVGAELAPLLVHFTRPYIPYTSARVHLGYANPSVAIGLACGAGLSWAYPQLGPHLRIGRFDRTYATLRASWSVYPPLPLPTDLLLEVNTAVRPRVHVSVEVGGGFGNVVGLFTTAGVHYQLAGDGGAGTDVLSAGLGLSWLQYALGPMASFGYERRF